MQIPYLFIFPNSFEEVQKIYMTLFVMDNGSFAHTDSEPPKLINESLCPPLLNLIGNTTTDFNDIMDTVTTTTIPNDNDADNEDFEESSKDESETAHSGVETISEESFDTVCDSF